MNSETIASPSIRTITLGLPIDPLAPELSYEEIKRFITLARRLLQDSGLSSRCIRVTCQPMDWMYESNATRGQLVKFAKTMEEMLGDEAWFCMPGPQFTHNSDHVESLNVIPDIIAETENVFTNTLVSNEFGIHRKAIRGAADVISQLAKMDESVNANFRFAVMANVASNTPFFPASYHAGESGFSLSLELSQLMNECFCGDGDINAKLNCFTERAKAIVSPVHAFAERLQKESGYQYKGMDFSLAPYPGENTSAVKAVELLNNTQFGDLDFLMSLYSVNNVLKTGFPDIPMVGYNGTMLSVLEDTQLAYRCERGQVSIKDLLLYANVCGCGLDMVPLPIETPSQQLATMIESIATLANKWNKPLIARLLPCELDSEGRSQFKHDFIVNTKPVSLESEAASNMADDYSYYKRPRLNPAVMQPRADSEILTPAT